MGTNGDGVAHLLDDPREEIRNPKRSQNPKSAERLKFVNFLIGGLPTSNAVNRRLFDANNTLWCATDAALYCATLVRNDIPHLKS